MSAKTEIGPGPLRACRYPVADARFQRDCHNCAREAPTVEIEIRDQDLNAIRLKR